MSRETRHVTIANRTAREHDAIDAHFQRFERALSDAAPVGGAAARQRMFRELEPLLGSLADHVSSAESPDGLLTRVEVAIGRNHDVSAARRLHRTATQQAAILSRTLGDAGVDHTDEEIQSIASRLGSAIRRHHEIEADLLLDAFEHEVGVGD